MSPAAAVPNLFGTRDQWKTFREDVFSMDWRWGMVLGWSKCTTFIVYFIFILWQSQHILPWLQGWRSHSYENRMLMWRGRAQEVMWAAVNTHEASPAHLLLTSCFEAWFLTGHGPVLGTPALQAPSSTFFIFKALHLLNQLTYFSPIFHCIPLSRQTALLAKAWKSPPFFSSYVFVISWPPWWLRW